MVSFSKLLQLLTIHRNIYSFARATHFKDEAIDEHTLSVFKSERIDFYKEDIGKLRLLLIDNG